MKRCTEGASDGSVKRSRMLVPQSEAQQAPVAASSSPPLDVYIHGEEVVRGQFYVDRYLADLDCIFYAGQWVSRSAFEKAARSTTAKWHCSIKVTARSKLSLGAWLEERRLPIKKGTQRKSRQQRAAEAEARRTPSPPPLPSTAPRPAPLPTSLPAPRPVHTALPQLAAPSPLPHCLLPAVQPPLLPSFPSFPSIPSFPSLPHQPLLLTPMASYPRVISTCLDAGPAHSRPTSPAASTSSTQQHHLPPAPPLAAPAAAAAVWRSPSPFLPPTRSVSPLLSGTDSVPSASGTSTAAAATAAAVAATATSPAAGKGLAAEAAAGVEAAAMVEVAARVVAEDVGVPLAGPVLEGDMVLGLGSIFEDGDLDDGDLQGALTDSFFAFLHADD